MKSPGDVELTAVVIEEPPPCVTPVTCTRETPVGIVLTVTLVDAVELVFAFVAMRA
jgi:hypothetical protein